MRQGRDFRMIVSEILKNKQKFFTLEKIVKITDFPRQNVRDILKELHRQGFLRRMHSEPLPYEQKKGNPRLNITYRIINPKILAEKIGPKFYGENNACDRIWFVIRKLGVFQKRDLCILAEAKKETVRWYTKLLARAGIIKQRGYGEWALIKDSGPRRPYVGDVKKVRSSE